ncbi:putative periplasmic or secreted lipoprotein [Desulfosporosinus orientis DSM 765]|uniref:Putative periplasmic or secreted lipoprotein n=1 Tax=Desulfosporosinus orientis (strain ATCC 19365 / DSM 765 / NCIMB 8382 / VKM B-1628 / Singapore I) TaxID=768706 RepID=G7WD66_DESOD|nr:type II toxin-antitoxin system HicA family toxin [Desulfosporosinus orientis]AET67551.1 putative periplasmic or secreted lipoprotein [Desulfosporosinus orientis DSM 765]
MKRRDLIKKLESNGFSKVRDHGDHTIYKAPNTRAVQVPRHREINEVTAKQILKDAGL